MKISPITIEDGSDADGKWHVYCALKRYQIDQPEIAGNAYFRDAINDAYAEMQKAVDDA